MRFVLCEFVNLTICNDLAIAKLFKTLHIPLYNKLNQIC